MSTLAGDNPLDALEARLGHRFRNRSLLERALTHASFSGDDNERLELLGDAVLDLVVVGYLYTHYEEASEGQLSELRSHIVSRRLLHRVGDRLGLAELLNLGPSLRSQDELPPSVIGNALEAVLGAVHLDGGFEAAQACALAWLEPSLLTMEEEAAALRAKQVLQTYSQRQDGSLPTYRLLNQHDESQVTAFQAAAVIGGRQFPAAWGSTKKEAERRAALLALAALREEGVDPSR